MGWAIATGTSGSVLPNMMVGATPVRNYLDSSLEGIEELDASTFHEKILTDRDNCDRCAVNCKLVVEYQSADAKHSIDRRYGGPEYETLGGLGALCAVTDILAVAKANELCAAYGLDTISAGGTIAFAMECVEKGLLEPDDDGFAPRFGDGDSLVEAIERIALRKGMGNLLAEGSARAAQELGGEALEMSVTVKGQELPLHEPRLKNAMGLGYAISPTGADHMANMDDLFATHDFMDVCARLSELGFEIPLPLYGLEEQKLKAYVTEVAYKNFLDSAVICHFYPYIYQHIVDAINGATGWEIDRDTILQAGKRIMTMGRLYLKREGFQTHDDRLPSRTLQPHTHADGPIAGKAMSEVELKDALKRFYLEMGWDENGEPLKETIRELKLEWIQ
jgi:aldehyde:ferredoxin oxidoreductase